MRVIDITLLISPASVTWPGQPPVSVSHVRHLDRGDHATVSQITMSVHTGTHVDAPSHFLRGGATLDEVDLDLLVGPAVVVDAEEVAELAPEVLERLRIPPGTERLLIRTRNSDRWAAGETAFRQDYVGLTPAAAQWLVGRAVRLLGTDYLSVAAWQHSVATHHMLLRAGVVLLEGLDLSRAGAGAYQLVCLPLRIAQSEGAPARAILIQEPPGVAGGVA
jgi:arylformamidase